MYLNIHFNTFCAFFLCMQLISYALSRESFLKKLYPSFPVIRCVFFEMLQTMSTRFDNGIFPELLVGKVSIPIFFFVIFTAESIVK
ncbi:MAG: hypothetical protein A4E23_01140 [Methanomethylovorans sp. PtaU1.Bin073]|nr:MAG: hypothetical protein A4E23_01140 [Methanomethylovorans sp. PtaU1.Bin073]